MNRAQNAELSRGRDTTLVCAPFSTEPLIDGCKKSFMPLCRMSLFFTALFTLLFFSTDSLADTVTFDLGFTFTGTAPTGTAPFVVAQVSDIGDNEVQLTLSGANLQDNTHGTGTPENVDGVYLNLATSLNSAQLAITYDSGIVATRGITQATNCCKADGDGFYDILFSFGEGMTGLMNGDTSVYTISNSSLPANTLTAASFEYMSAMGGGQGSYYAAAHVQNTGNGGSGSAFIGATSYAVTPVPLPGDAWLLLSGLAGLGALSRRRLLTT